VALAVDGLCDEFLSRPAFARDQDGDIGARHLADRRKDLLHPGACPQHSLERVILRLHLELCVFPLERRDVLRPSQDRLEFADIDRFVENVVGPARYRFQGMLLL